MTLYVESDFDTSVPSADFDGHRMIRGWVLVWVHEQSYRKLYTGRPRTVVTTTTRLRFDRAVQLPFDCKSTALYDRSTTTLRP